MNALTNVSMHKDACMSTNMQKPCDGLVSSLSTTVVNVLVRIGEETACLPICCSVNNQKCGLCAAIACVALQLSC